MTDPAFRLIADRQSGFHVWRIEKLQVVPVSKESWGKFYDGDSYIVYCASMPGESGAGCNMKVKSAGNVPLEQHVHFWLGLECSQDEAAVAAFKTVELDDFLGGHPVQHREVQGHESKRFLSYFKEGIRILHGGISSGLNVVLHDKQPKLFLVKGKRQPIIRQLPTISWAEFNSGDSFVLDTAEYIFVWNGKLANRLEKLQAAKLAQKLKEEHQVNGVVILEDGNESHTMTAQESAAFQDFLPLDAKSVAESVLADDQVDVACRKLIKLYECSDQEGTLRIREVKSGPLEQSDLNSKDSYIVDNGSFGIWVWVGKKASHQERAEAMRNAQGFIKKKGYDAFTLVTRVIDGGEPMEFKCLFKKWLDKDQTTSYTFKRKYSMNTVQTKFDAHFMHESPQVAADTGLVDDGQGEKQIFRVHNFELEAVPEEEHGKFYSGDCYVVLYAYSQGAKQHYIIYYWLGSHSSTDEQGTAALKTIEMDNALGGAAVQVRVVQGKEPAHFLFMFHGRLIIFKGGLASSFDGPARRDTKVGDTYLLQVHGNAPQYTCAVQVDFAVASLNTNDCFVLVSPRETFVWLGKSSTGDEKEMAKLIATNSSIEPTIVYEGQERQDFWSAIGGRGPYTDERVLKRGGGAGGLSTFAPRLFHASNASGAFMVEEIFNFAQTDLVSDDVMILDIGDTIFIWLGRYSNRQEREAAMTTSREYLMSDPSDRNPDIPIMVIKQGFEPPNFTGFFGAWDASLFDSDEDQGVDQLHGVQELALRAVHNGGGGGAAGQKVFPYETLKNVKDLPIDPTQKEAYLCDADFEKLFGMNRESFMMLPAWKRDNLKKSLGLF